MMTWKFVQFWVLAIIVTSSIPTETATCSPSGIVCYPTDCSTQFQQRVGDNIYPAQDVVPGAVCFQGAIINASDPVCVHSEDPTTTTTGDIVTTTTTTTGGGSTTGTLGDTVLSSSFSRDDFNTLFPHANGAFIRGDVNQYGIFSYDNFNEASRSYPSFAGTGDVPTRKREVAAFLAQTSHETSGWWTDQPFNWGYFFSTELCSSGNCVYCSGSDQYPCSATQSYYGRGPIQISWNYNYGAASEVIFGQRDTLLNNPDMVLQDGVLAFKTALWFWMTEQPPKPSAHNVITGNWTPSAQDIEDGRLPGFGLITNIINGALECQKPTPATVTARVGYFATYTTYFNITDGGNLYCNNMTHY